MLTVFFSWAPLALAGIGLVRMRVVHATMRGAGLLRVLARLAITILVAAVIFPLLFTTTFVGDMTWSADISLSEGSFALVIALGITLPIASLSAFGIRAWHRVLEELSSHRSESRLLI